MELGINQIVLMIIGIVVLSLGLILVGKIMNGGTEKLNSANQQILNRFQNSMSSDEVVQIPMPNRKVPAKKLETFYLGILNDPSVSDDNEDFFIIVTENNDNGDSINSILILDEDKNSCNQENSKCKVESIYQNEISAIPIGFSAKEGKLTHGDFVYNVCVCKGDECHGLGGTTIKECNSEQIGNIDNLYGFESISISVR